MTGKKHAGATSKALTTASTRPDKPLEKEAHEKHVLQLLQPFLGFSEYQVAITSRGTDGKNPIPMPAMEYRVTYVPTRFTYTQICVRSFFTFTSVCMLFAYAFGVATAKKFELGQLWMIVLLVLLVALNDPMYIARVMLGGNHALYNISVLGQICFSGGLFLFWLVYADGMNAPSSQRGCCFYFPKVLLVCIYIGVSATMFLVHGRVPDRISVHDALHEDPQKFGLVVALTASLVAVGLWLSFLVTRAVFRLGWKKVEYIYTEREKSFVGITIVFVILWLCGHLYRAVHGRRGSWMRLQLPFLTLTNSYLALLTHAFWPGAEGKGGVAPAEAKGSAADDERRAGSSPRGRRLTSLRSEERSSKSCQKQVRANGRTRSADMRSMPSRECDTDGGWLAGASGLTLLFCTWSKADLLRRRLEQLGLDVLAAARLDDELARR